MTELYQPVAQLIAEVRARWRRLVLLRAIARAAVSTAVVLAVLLFLGRAVGRAPLVVGSLAIVGLIALAAGVSWTLRAWRQRLPDSQIARFIEERSPELDERLVSAVSIAGARPEERPALADAAIRDAARASQSIDPAAIVATDRLRRAGVQAAAAVLVLIAVLVVGRHLVTQSFDALALSLFPSRLRIEVVPGDARVPAGAHLGIGAKLVGNDAPVTAHLLWALEGSDEWQTQEMRSTDARSASEVQGLRFQTTLSELSSTFHYRVVTAGASSPVFTVTVVRPPRVKSIDVEYTYPRALGLPDRREDDGGDIYAPEGTAVRVFVNTDPPAASGRLVLAGADPIALSTSGNGQSLSGGLTISQDGSYRVALADSDGIASQGDTEYFIRMLDDRPPEVHVVRPASDRRVTALEEVDIEAQADDDFGVASMELVYAVRGGAEKTVPLRIPSQQTTVTGRHTLYLEDLDVRVGDFVSYYVRARDLERGKRSSEARSDIFFLEIKPFEEEFTLAQSQAAQGGGASNPEIDDLVNAQKEIIVATWKLDRRSQAARGAQSAKDIQAVGTAEAELKTRTERAASAFGQTRMRAPRRPAAPGGRGAPAPGPAAGQTLPEEDAMTLAVRAMDKAANLLNGLKTADAVAPEMDALNQLLRAQGDVRKREVQRQQAGAGSAGNRNTQDLSSLFDKELARRQETNYETPSKSSQNTDDKTESALDKIKDLARRQDELTKQQQELARRNSAMSEEERRRELARLTRDQNELQRQADALAQQMAQQRGQDGQKGQEGQEGQEGQAGQTGQQGQAGQTGRGGQAGQPGQSGQPRPGENGRSGQTGQNGQTGQAQNGRGAQPGQGTAGGNSRQLREISEAMRSAANDLQRDDAAAASARAAQALDQLRELERQVQAATPEGRRRALGDAELEARQLADAERRIAAESGRAGTAGGNPDTLRRLAGEQERLGERARQLQQGLRSSDAETAREMERQRLSERMQESADGLRASAQGERGRSGGAAAGSSEEIARTLDRMADRIASAARDTGDRGQRPIENGLTRVQELREQIDDISRQLDRLNRQSNGQPAARGGQASVPAGGPTQPGAGGQSAAAQPSPGGAPSASAGTPSPQGQGGNGDGAAREVAELQAQATRALQELRSLTEEARRDDSSMRQGAGGRTFEGQGMVLSAPGTEGFKQDFARWQELTKQVTAALDQVESSFARRLQEQETRDRLASGLDDKAPAEYQSHVDSYFRALATRKKP